VIAPANSRRAIHDPAVTLRIDLEAESGDCLPALARLLVTIDRRRRERTAAEPAGEQNTQAKPENP